LQNLAKPAVGGDLNRLPEAGHDNKQDQ